MSLEEAAIWGDLSPTPETYPTDYGVIPQDAALNHMVLLLLDRRDYEKATEHAQKIFDEKLRAAILALVN